ncbi:uncharacterized protein LOC108914194 isoform X2 [Anoplophora glabripennis]|uniref:uncharacterized protein LOC108914194 isoform X2 n=1 Tax=Anoplophora glabripennis TaxID=217634 RepID=UPI0008745697|nr:uncharacterized protein LOC108914194 isoform X2 [Anoplophora glabripennis]
MSVCFEATNVLAKQVGTSSATSQILDEIATTTPSSSNNNVSANIIQPPVTTNVIQSPINSNIIHANSDKSEQQVPAAKSIAKLVVANHPSANNCNPVLQKVVNPPLITVLNPSGPLTVVKTLCVTSGVSSAPQFTLVNSTPLNVTNAVGKSPTITLLNAPVTVVKAITTQSVEKTATDVVANSVGLINNASPVIENRGHNVFVKNTCPDSTVPDVPQSHKLLTANSFPQTNVLTNINSSSKAVNGQRSKLKILSNVVMPGTSQTTNNILLNKNPQRYVPRQKIIGPNGATTKYISKPTSNNVVKTTMNSNLKMQDKSPTRVVYPTHKSQIKTIPPINNYMQKPQQGIKTLSPQHKSIPGQVQRTGSGLRTIPPQRPQKIANKPNYIGKHAVQAQKMRQTHGKLRGIKMTQNVAYNVHGPQMPDKHLTELTFNQALTAQIIETLSNTSTSLPYEILPTRYQNAFSCPDTKQAVETTKQTEDKSKSGLDALSLICQAVLLDHNYNATLPPDSPTRPSPPSITQSQINGISTNSIYSPGTGKRRSLPSSNTISSTSSLSNLSVTASNSNSIRMPQDDDASSDISDGSERKHDTEGEETDTAPEAEAVNDEHFDGYGDYVTRCICGFLHDDGYMVECDRCKVWQHVQCVVKNKQVPEEYLCEACDPTKPIDRQRARNVQQQWVRDRQFADPKLRKDAKVKEVFKPKETISDSDTSDGEHVSHNNNVVTKGRTLTNRRKSDNHQKQTIARQRREAAKEVSHRRQKRKERKIVRRKTKAQTKSHSDDENHDTWSSHLPQLRQWIEKYEEAVTNHYSPELRARISSIRVNSAHSDLNMQFDPTVSKCRVHTQPLTEIKYLVSTVHLSPNSPVVELRGKYMLSTQHRNSGGSLTTRQHSQRPGPFLFFYRLHKDNTEVCVDTRTYGNSARFIRRSCKPNAELRHCIEKGVLHLYIVSITTVERNCELTIKHESHDLAAIGTTQIACACGNAEQCAVNKSTIKKNNETSELQRKRRGRRTVSSSLPEADPPKEVKEEPQPLPVVLPPPPVAALPSPVKHEKVEEIVKRDIVEVKLEIKEELLEEPVAIKEEVKEEIKVEPTDEKLQMEVKKEQIKEEEARSPSDEVVTNKRRSSLNYKSDKEDDKPSDTKEEKTKCKKLSREERKLEAILRAIEQMEKAESRKQEHQAKQAHRRESEPGPTPKEEDKQEPKLKRRRRKGRARTTSQSARRNRLNSTDSYMTSGDENMLSPNDGSQPTNRPSLKELSSEPADNRAVGLLLALSNGENTNKLEKSPTREVDSNSNSAHSSPETPLSSACLLVQAAVEPLEPGFKFPKTKKGLMNEWLNKVPEPIHSASSISPSSLTPHLSNSSEFDANSGFYSPAKNLTTLAQAVNYCDSNVQPRGSAKKRWLRQAISEDHSCDSPSSRPDSPPISDMVAPPKKRRLPRESISSETSPPTTPTNCTAPTSLNKLEKERPNQEGCVEIVYSGTDGDSPTQTLESDAILKERAAKMKQEFSKCIVPSTPEGPHNEMGPLGCLMDPRLSRESHMFSNNDLVGTVEKTLSILGFEENKPDTTLPKRKLSITEYRQRKKLNVNDKSDDHEQEPEQMSTEENNSSESFKITSRLRSGSTSSSTSLTSSDDEISPELPIKVPAFNSEPTELERQREISSLRLKKAFGLSVDEEPRPALNVEAILNLELEPKVKPIPIPSPTFPIPGSSEVTRETTPTPKPPLSPERSVSPAVLPPEKSPSPPVDIEMEEEPAAENVPEKGTTDENVEPNLFYTPDEEEAMQAERVFEESNSVNYVPPFNNPVYPNSSFTNYTSTIDDDARYEGRNPSPPPDLESVNFDSQS